MSERSGKGKGKRYDRSQDWGRHTWAKVETEPTHRWQPAEGRSSSAVQSPPEQKAYAPEGATTAASSSSVPSQMSASTKASPSASSSLSTNAAAFVPGQSLSGAAAVFVPSASAAAFVPSANAEAFVPGKSSWSWTERSTNAAEFVPSAVEFVPGQSSWSGAPGPAGNEASWQSSMYAASFEPAANTMYSGAQFTNVSAATAGPFASGGGEYAPCLFNLDAFSTESSSDDERADTRRQAAAPQAPLAKELQDNGSATPAANASSQAIPPAEAPDRSPTDTPSATPAASQTVAPLDTPSSSPVVGPVATPSLSSAAPPLAELSASLRSSRSPSPTRAHADSDDFHSPMSSAVLESPAMTSKTVPRIDRTLSDDPISDNEPDEFSLPKAAAEECPIVEAAIVSEMSERTLKEWLRRFANDRDTELFGRQWHKWTANGAGENPQEVVRWLLRCGLDDCRSASSVSAAIDLLLRKEGLPPTTVEHAFAEYSEDDLEDLQLDNPRALDFAASIQEILGTFAAEEKRPADVVRKQEEVVPEIATCNGLSDGEASHALKSLLEVRRKLLQNGEIENYKGPRWSTETAAKLFAPMPTWQQQRMSRGAPATAGDTSATSTAPGSGEWREAQKRSLEARMKSREDKSGKKTGRQKEALMPVGDNSWVAQLKRWKDKDQVDQESTFDEQFLRELRSTLNKLTVEKFEQLSDHLIFLISQSTRPNRGIPAMMQLVFEKATTQHHFIDMYVNLCVKIHQWLTANNDIVRVESQTNFKRILLNQCQNSFEQYLEPPGSLDGLSGDSLYEAQVKYKTKMLGNIKLVGQLIRQGMLSPKIALSVSAELVRDDPIVREERLETLAVFLETIGPSLDDPNWSHSAQFETVFSEVQRLSNDRAVRSRIRCLLRDVLDLRREKWQARKVRAFDGDAPTTLAEVHEKAKLDQNSAKGGGRSGAANDLQKLKKRGSSGGTPTPSPAASPKAKPNHTMRRYVPPNFREPSFPGSTSPPSAATAGSASSRSNAPETKEIHNAGSQRTAAGTATRSSKPKDESTELAEAGTLKEGLVAGLQKAVAGAASRASTSKEEILSRFHKEVAQIIRQVGKAINITEGVQRLRECSLPSDCVHEEVVDLIARMVDEPKERRKHLFPLLRALFDDGVFSPLGFLSSAVTDFIEEAFVDPGSVDPPDLVDIVLREMLPALGVALNTLNLTPCIAELFDEMDDGG